MPPITPCCVIAVDIGNSQIKLGCFLPAGDCQQNLPSDMLRITATTLRLPDVTLRLPLDERSAGFDTAALRQWFMELPMRTAMWVVASVNRRAHERLQLSVGGFQDEMESFTFRTLSYRDLSLQIDLPDPGRVGMDRLVAAEAANEVRPKDRGVIVIDHGSAITVDLVDSRGAFVGGAIMPGLVMAARALTEQTDALPLVDPQFETEPPVCGTSTYSAISAGLYWGSRGALETIVRRHSATQPEPPEVLLTGGGAADLTAPLAQATGLNVRHLPHLVLSGVDLVARSMSVETRN